MLKVTWRCLCLDRTEFCFISKRSQRRHHRVDSSSQDCLSTEHMILWSHPNIFLERFMHSICYNFTAEVRFLITLVMIQQRNIFVGQRYSQHEHTVLPLFIHHGRFSTVQWASDEVSHPQMKGSLTNYVPWQNETPAEKQKRPPSSPTIDE